MTEDTTEMTDAQIKKEKVTKTNALQDEIKMLEAKIAIEEQKVKEAAEKQKQIPKKAAVAASSARGGPQAELQVSGFKVSYKLNLVPSIAAYDVTITS